MTIYDFIYLSCDAYWYWTSGFGKGGSRSRANVSFGTAQYYYDYSF